jgi:hypothetical protein
MNGDFDGVPHIFIERAIRLWGRNVGDVPFVGRAVRGAKRLQNNITRRSEDIGAQRIWGPDLLVPDRLEYTKERLRPHIFGVGMGTQFTESQVVDTARVLLEQVRPGRFDPVPDALNEFGIRRWSPIAHVVEATVP